MITFFHGRKDVRNFAYVREDLTLRKYKLRVNIFHTANLLRFTCSLLRFRCLYRLMLLWLTIAVCFSLQNSLKRVINRTPFSFYLSPLATILEATALFVSVFRYSAVSIPRSTIVYGEPSSDRSFVSIWSIYKLGSKSLKIS